MKVETIRPRITGKLDHMKLMEKPNRKKGNITTHTNGNNFGINVIVIDSTCLPITSLGSDVADLSSASTGIWASSFTESSVESNTVEIDVVEILTTPTGIMPPSLPNYAAFRSIPPLTMKPRLTRGSSQEALLEDTSPEMTGMELVTTLAAQTSNGRTSETPPKPADAQNPHSLPPISCSTPRPSVHQAIIAEGVGMIHGGVLDGDQEQ